MRLVEDHQAARKQRAEPLPHRVRVGRVDQQVVRDQESAVRPPRVHAEPTLTPHRREVLPVQQFEHQPEPLVELRLPLVQHRRRRRDHDRLALLAQQQLAGNQPGLDRLAETSVVRDEQIHTREPQRLAKRLHLIGVDLDPCTERRLEQIRIGRGDRSPAQRIEERGELPRLVEPARGEIGPPLLLEDAAIELVLPEDLDHLALRVVIRACQGHDR